MFVKIIERTFFWYDKTLVTHCSLGAFLVALVFYEVIVKFRFIYIAYILKKQHCKYVVLVLAGVYYAAESVAGFPYSAVDVLLGDFFCIHIVYLFISLINNWFIMLVRFSAIASNKWASCFCSSEISTTFFWVLWSGIGISMFSKVDLCISGVELPI